MAGQSMGRAMNRGDRPLTSGIQFENVLMGAGATDRPGTDGPYPEKPIAGHRISVAGDQVLDEPVLAYDISAMNWAEVKTPICVVVKAAACVSVKAFRSAVVIAPICVVVNAAIADVVRPRA